MKLLYALLLLPALALAADPTPEQNKVLAERQAQKNKFLNAQVECDLVSKKTKIKHPASVVEEQAAAKTDCMGKKGYGTEKR
jgi:hypothetical protein